MQNVVGQPQSVQAQPQAQSVQVPNYSGVNIQIFNPSVVAPGGAAPISTINSPNYTTSPSVYPPNYYTQNLNPTANATANVNGNTQSESAPEKKKTEKREIVQLTDDYVKTVEGYLDSQDPQVRMQGAKEVLARLQEDDSRKDDVALNALVNKMLQDPSQQVKFLALAALDSRIATGDSLTVQLLQGIQKQDSAYGEDSLKASNILLKMSGTTTKKEFEVKEKPAEKASDKKESEKK